MRYTRGQVVEVDTLESFDRRVAGGATSMSGWHLQGVDLTGRSADLARCAVAGALFLGCTFADGDESHVRERGGVVFPEVPGVPVHTYRTTLYAPRDLYDSDTYADSLDARAYAWSQQTPDVHVTLAQALHDHAIDDALTDWIDSQAAAGRRLVGVMGSHSLQRGEQEYVDAARLGHLLGSSNVLATGGGPGAMEAANLGAFLSGAPTTALDDSLSLLAGVASYQPDIGAWAGVAFDVIDRFPAGTASLGIPTWHYGHEPPNPFATAIAKYFRNATREAILLQVCDAGIVFLPGAGGTVQEIFQDACENYYADEGSVAAMVLVGSTYWTRDVPAWPLLQSIARGRAMEQHVHLVDTVDEAAALIGG